MFVSIDNNNNEDLNLKNYSGGGPIVDRLILN